MLNSLGGAGSRQWRGVSGVVFQMRRLNSESENTLDRRNEELCVRRLKEKA